MENILSNEFKSHPLFEPLKLKNITAPSRIVRSATEMFLALPDGHTDEAEIKMFKALAPEHIGIIMTGHSCVSPEGRSNPGQNAIWDDEFIPDQCKIATAAKIYGSKVMLQLGHGGMKAEGSNGGRPVYTPDTMTKEQIKATVKAFAKAAYRAKLSGFNGIELHGAHYYLLSQFFYPQINHRTDEYGGCAENRFRIIRECAEAVKIKCGDNFPVLLKINGDDGNPESDYFNDLCKAVEICEKCGIEAVEISGSSANPAGKPAAPYFFETARKLHEITDINLILVGGIRTLSEIETILSSGISAVSFSRPFICRPDFITRLFESDDKKSECITCNGCFSHFDRVKNTRCIKQTN